MGIWRFTGNPENWLTALHLNKWAVNENNKGLWENKFEYGDTVLFHSTKKTGFSAKTESSIIGFGYIKLPLFKKSEHWWIQEHKDNQNYWPYVVPLGEIYIFSDLKNWIHKEPIHLIKKSKTCFCSC